jgi:hypothetical protein
MIERGLTAGEFCLRVLQKQIDDLGDDAFAHADVIVLYSGPRASILKTTGLLANPPRSEKQATDQRASRIDDTAIGKFLESIDLYAYFKEVYSDKEDIRDAVRGVWAYASRKFMHSGFHTVETSVCGADPERVFRADELPELLTQDTPVEIINKTDIKHFKEIYMSHGDPKEGFAAAYAEVCKTELDMIHDRASTALPDEEDELWEEFRQRKIFFDLGQIADAATVALTAVGAGKPAVTRLGPTVPAAKRSASGHGFTH